MSLRIGIDLDGTLADLSGKYHEYEARLFGVQAPEPVAGVDTDDAPNEESASEAEISEPPSDKERIKAAREATRRHRAVWMALQQTPDFWMTLAPIESGAVSLLHQTARRLDWEVLFITKRPPSAGRSVQAQSQEWLIAQGFPAPSVLTHRGSRGRIAHALELDFLVDDLAQNCVDIIADSKCQPIWVCRTQEKTPEAAALRLKITVARSVADAIHVMSQPAVEARDGLVSRVLTSLGFSR